jgi:insertion element IS1 protein InsB
MEVEALASEDKETAKTFWKKIKEYEMKYIVSDYWKPSESIMPEEKHLQTKAETFTVERYNCLFRHFLVRMSRK